MATFTKRGTRVRCQLMKDGIRISQSFASMGAARAWAAEVSSGRLVTATQAPTLATIMAKYAKEVSPGKGGARWEILRIKKWRSETWTDRQIGLITPESLGRWRDARLKEVSAGTVLREFTLLGAIFELARRELRLVKENPVRDTRKPTAPPDRRRRVSDDEIALLVQALDYSPGDKPVTMTQRVAVMVLFAVETGMRSGELCGIGWSDVHPRFIRLPASLTKTRRSREVPLTPKAQELLALLDRGTKTVFDVSSASRDALFRKGRDRSGVHDLCFHDLRSEAIWRLSKRFTNILDLAMCIGHSDINSLRFYYRATGNELADQLEKTA